MDIGNTSWKDLFESASSAEPVGARCDVLVFKKAREPLLIVPRHVPGMAAALDIYPAQTPKARVARFFWRQGLRWNFRAGADTDSLTFNRTDPFIQFLAKVSRAETDSPPGTWTPPRFAILAGNPHASGRRFLVLVFSHRGEPLAVVKTGTTPKANELIAKEVSFLTTAPAGLIGIPQVRDQFRAGRISAYAMDYVAGISPRPQAAGIETLLGNWLQAGSQRQVKDLAAWRRLADAAATEPVFTKLAKTLSDLPVQAPVFHGDLTPWNIKIPRTNGAWVVLDWERGELGGPPAWDWFHFVLQPAMLVRRQSARVLARTAQALLDSAAFEAYARAAGLAGHERSWLLAYLLYCRDVLRPAEGSPRVVELLSLLAAQWTND